MVAASEEERFSLAINGYFFAYIPILLGVIAAAAGVERSIGGATDRLDLGSAVFLAVGVAMFLLGDVSFRRVMGIRPVGARALAAVAAAATVALGIAVAGLAQLVGLVVIVVAALAAEARWTRAR